MLKQSKKTLKNDDERARSRAGSLWCRVGAAAVGVGLAATRALLACRVAPTPPDLGPTPYRYTVLFIVM